MIYKEEVRDLFSVPEDYYLAHCISADFGMGKGIAVEFVKRFDTRNQLYDLICEGFEFSSVFSAVNILYREGDV